jgi:hypothetical protein
MRNIAENPRVALIIDHYEEEWSLPCLRPDSQFAVDSGCAPERVGGVHLPNQIPNFAIY